MAGPHAGNRNRPAYSGQPRFRFPKQIIQLFAPRKPLEFKPPPRKRRLRPMTGLADFVSKFSSTQTTLPAIKDGQIEKSTQNATTSGDKPSVQEQQPKNQLTTEKFETPAQRRRRVKQEKQDRVRDIILKARETWDPRSKPTTTAIDENNSLNDKPVSNGVDTSQGVQQHQSISDNTTSEKTNDPYSTIFVWNVPHTTIELRLQDAFEEFGPVRTVVMPKDRDGIPRGYAFVEFEEERHADLAVRQADGIRVDGRRLRVDVERGRTVKGWLPKRLDGPYNSFSRRRK